MNHLGDYDVIVIGAGHAGIEAAHAAATLGAKTAVFTMVRLADIFKVKYRNKYYKRNFARIMAKHTDFLIVAGTCIKCQACVRKCTRHAKYFEDAAFLSHVAMLEQNFTEPKKNEAFL